MLDIILDHAKDSQKAFRMNLVNFSRQFRFSEDTFVFPLKKTDFRIFNASC